MQVGFLFESTRIKIIIHFIHSLIIMHFNFQAMNGTKNVFVDLFTTRSFNHLNAVFEMFTSEYEHTLESVIKSTLSGDFQRLILNIVKYSQNKAVYFAQRLSDSMSKRKVDNMTLMRLIISRCEIDLGDIKVEFKNLYKKDLATLVSKKTSKDFEKGLLQLIG